MSQNDATAAHDPSATTEPVGGLMIGIDVGGTSIKGALVDQRGRLVFTGTPTQTRDENQLPTIESVVGKIVHVGFELVHAAKSQFPDSQLFGAGVVVPGIIDEERGVAYDALQVQWKGEALSERVGDVLRLPVWLDHDVRAAGIAEGLWGAAIGVHDYLVVAIGTGVGAALVIDGKPYRRAGGIGCEFGHTSVNFGEDAVRCGCGRTGCVEAYASGTAIARRYAALSHRDPNEMSAQRVMAAVTGGDDPIATRVCGEAFDALAHAITNCVVLFAPELVMIGGGVAEGNPWIIDEIERRMITPNFMSYLQRDAPPVQRPMYGRQAGIAGAAASAWARSGVPRRRLTRTA